MNLGSFGIAVQNLECSVAFYRDGLGLDLVAAPTAATVDESRNRVMGTPGAKSRSVRFAIPNEPFAIELVEYAGIDRKPMMAHHNDPGASFLNVGYVDVRAIFNALRKFNPRMVGEGSFPTGTNPGGGLNPTWIRDPDGVIIELMHGGWDDGLKAFPSVHNAHRAPIGPVLAAIAPTRTAKCSSSKTRRARRFDHAHKTPRRPTFRCGSAISMRCSSR